MLCPKVLKYNFALALIFALKRRAFLGGQEKSEVAVI